MHRVETRGKDDSRISVLPSFYLQSGKRVKMFEGAAIEHRPPEQRLKPELKSEWFF